MPIFGGAGTHLKTRKTSRKGFLRAYWPGIRWNRPNQNMVASGGSF
jgi:hypothetical protein